MQWARKLWCSSKALWLASIPIDFESCSGDSESSHNGSICVARKQVIAFEKSQWTECVRCLQSCKVFCAYESVCLVFTQFSLSPYKSNRFYRWQSIGFLFFSARCIWYGRLLLLSTVVLLFENEKSACTVFAVFLWVLVEIKQTTIQMKSKFSHFSVAFFFISCHSFEFSCILKRLCFVFSSRFGTLAENVKKLSNNITTTSWNGTVNIRNGNL